MLEVVEDDQHVGEHQRHVGQAERRRGWARRACLDRAHEVVAEVADRAAGERRQRRATAPGVNARDLLGRERVGVAAVAQRPAQHLARAHADERVAPDALALLGRLEQERRELRVAAAQLQERARPASRSRR